jgi:glyoxylase-like metal-dependent hydrolase (beta-lactamase superfamily II)
MQISALPEDAPLTIPDGIELLTADNPGPMTLTGTNTWILSAGAGDVVVIDPGPVLPAHLAAIRTSGRIAAVLFTHRHVDHTESRSEFGIAPVYAASPEFASGTPPLADGDLLRIGRLEIAVFATPGHTADSVCFLLGTPGGEVLFTGDTLLGGSTTIIAPPDGSLADYFTTMTRLEPLEYVLGLPGHGPAFSSVGAWAGHNVEYRETRLAQLARVFEATPRSGADADILARVASTAYGDDAPVSPHIEAMVNAQLLFLSQRGDIAGWDYRSPDLSSGN